MLPKHKRLPRELFKELLDRSRYAHSAHFSLRFRLSNSCGTQVAVSVSKKISKLAVIRNRTRRRAYSALAPLFSSIPGGMFLLIAKSGAEKLQGEVLSSELEALIRSVQ